MHKILYSKFSESLDLFWYDNARLVSLKFQNLVRGGGIGLKKNHLWNTFLTWRVYFDFDWITVNITDFRQVSSFIKSCCASQRTFSGCKNSEKSEVSRCKRSSDTTRPSNRFCSENAAQHWPCGWIWSVFAGEWAVVLCQRCGPPLRYIFSARCGSTCVCEWPFVFVSQRINTVTTTRIGTHANTELRAYEHRVVACLQQLWQYRLYSKFFQKGSDLQYLRRLFGRQRLLVGLCERFQHGVHFSTIFWLGDFQCCTAILGWWSWYAHSYCTGQSWPKLHVGLFVFNYGHASISKIARMLSRDVPCRSL